MKKRFLPYTSKFVLAVGLFCQFFLSIPVANAQYGQGQQGLRANEFKRTECDIRSLELTVFSDAKHKKRLDRQAVAKVYDEKRAIENWRTSTQEGEMIFCLDYGVYNLDISAVGYLTEHKVVQIDTSLQTFKLEITLQKDPTAVDLNASDADLPVSARKDVKSATSALKNSNLKDAQKRLERAYQLAPGNAQINFLMGYLFLLQKDLDKSESYLSRAATLDPRQAQTLTLLGRVQLQRGHYADARKSLEQAVDDNSGYWMAHNLLADAYLKEKEYEKARQHAQLAFDQGKGAATSALLALGQALANLGRDKEGIEALQNFLQASPNDSTAPQVRAFIADVEKRDKTRSAEIQPSSDLVLEASQPSLPPSSWGPPGVDDVKPAVVAGVVCPYDRLMEMSGGRVKQLVDNISQFAAVEDLLHEQLDPTGNPLTKETRKFDYVASVMEPKPGLVYWEEYRNTRYGIDDLPDRIVTTSFMSVALIFHPAMRENFEITCEGLGDWKGQATWLMHFRQRDDKPNRLADLVVGGQIYPINLKGRAWITADNFQIVRIESELMNRIPLLAVRHQIAEYGPIHFQKGNVDLWLPKSVDLYLELNRRRYYRRHSFDHYMLFAINAEEKSQTPKNKPPETSKQNR